jgi:hypothetical protein
LPPLLAGEKQCCHSTGFFCPCVYSVHRSKCSTKLRFRQRQGQCADRKSRAGSPLLRLPLVRRTSESPCRKIGAFWCSSIDLLFFL